LWGAAEWLATYGSENAEEAQGWANVVAFLMLTAESKENRSVLSEAKKKFAKENGIPVSQVRIKKEAQIIREGLALIPDVVNN
jgi:hypothetical protein